jgi:hypothetical protein
MKAQDEPQIWWTADELVEGAAARGLDASPRLIRNWTEEGLIDRPRLTSLGRGHGMELGVWPENQLRLFLLLLEKRQRQHVRRDGGLAKVPVALWLWYGDDFAPLRQVRRALRTWARLNQSPPLSAADATARAVVDRLSHPDARRAARIRFRDAITRSASGELLSVEELAAAALPAIDPHRTGPRGPAGASLSARDFAGFVDAMVAGVDAVLLDRGGELLPDRMLDQARREYVATHNDYDEKRAVYAADPDLGHMHNEQTLSDLFEDVCKDLVAVLGFKILATRRRGRRKPRPESGASARR